MVLNRFPKARLTEARSRVSDAVHHTPLLRSRTLSQRVGTDVWLKCENLQKTGAFKVRGALNRLSTLTDDERARGVATISAGNHAQAVAWAAAISDTRCVVVMPEHASPTKVRASEGYGAEVVLHGDAAAAFVRVREISAEQGLTFVHPFDDEEVVAGHASCGLEVVEALNDAFDVVVPVGGGGLSSGIAVALEASGSTARIWGVEPAGANAMHRSFVEGRAVTLPSVDTVADGLAAPMAGALNYEILAARAEGIAVLDDDTIVDAMTLLLERTKLLVETSGAAALAAVLAEAIPVDPNRDIVVVLSGGNADLAQLGELLRTRD
ncbi:MAG: threonine/serine dehydratase [Gemmatimonadota bacterium]